MRNQNREGNWQANLNVGPFSFFNVVAKAIRRKEKKEETYGHVENEILYMLMKTEREGGKKKRELILSYLRRTPPRREALRHSGGERRRWTSPTVTLYLDVDDRRDRRPGTEQNTSVGETGPDSNTSFVLFYYFRSSNQMKNEKINKNK